MRLRDEIWIIMALVVSSAGVSGAASMRNAIIGRFLDEARSISLPTCEDAVALSDNISTKALAPLTARAIASAYRAPAFYVTRRDPARHSVSSNDAQRCLRRPRPAMRS